ncbi:MAG: CHAT domain-containing protein, partial [Anaerolineales bacterium]
MHEPDHSPPDSSGLAEQTEAIVAQLLAGEARLPPLAAPLTEALAARVVERLKQAADRHWSIDPHRSLHFADLIVGIGESRADRRQIALGRMARGDALKFLGRTAEAWEALDQAGQMFRAAGDEVGWARTRIGRLYLSVKLNQVADTLADAERAREIFVRYGEAEKLLRLNLNEALVYTWLGEPSKALHLYHSALAVAQTMGEAGQQYIGPLYTNIGYAHEALGDFRQALANYERARNLFLARQETRNVAAAELNIAYIAQAQGHYRRALRLLHGVLEQVAAQFPLEATLAKRDMVECYLVLNRYAEARDLAGQVIRDYRAFSAAYEVARTLLHLATAEAELSNFTSARAALEEAEPIFSSLGATSWIATTHLRRGRMDLRLGDSAAAYREAAGAARWFESAGQQVNYASATLLQGQALLALEDLPAAAAAGTVAVRIAQRYNVPALRYKAHLLLGQIAETQHDLTHAVRRYRAAAATTERVQRGLTITLRPGFLEDKGEAGRALIRMQLRAGQAGEAFETLECAKAQVSLGYLANRERLRWAQDDPHSRALIEELNHLRAEHQWFYRLAHDPPADAERPSAVQPQQALAEVAARERRMRAITEQLYLYSGVGRTANPAPRTSLRQVQQALSEEALLVEFYNDGVRLWAFTLDRQTIEAHRLPLTVETLNQLLAQLQVNFAAALKLNAQAPAARNLTRVTQQILGRLHDSLLEPLALQRRGSQRLVIVPYGALHYLPFHLLHDGASYLIERREVVVLPAAGLAIQPGPKREPGALILAHAWEGRLPHTQAEAQIVQQLFGGRVCNDEAANRTALQSQPKQILHIAAHGHHRLDQPDMSYLQLADGQLYADDLLQQDLSYELVTLSACETGRANVAGGDELIGLGRGFLYAGAGALVLS